MEIYNIALRGNFYEAGRYQLSVRHIKVLSLSLSNAMREVSESSDEVVNYFKTKKGKHNKVVLRVNETHIPSIICHLSKCECASYTSDIRRNVLFDGKIQTLNIKELQQTNPEYFI